MSQAELEIGRTVIRTVKFEYTQAEIETIVAEHVKRTHSVKLRDFTLGAQVGQRSEDGRFYVIVSGEARTDGLAPTRKRKAKA